MADNLFCHAVIVPAALNLICLFMVARRVCKRLRMGEQLQGASAKDTADVECPKVQHLIHTIVLQPDQQVPHLLIFLMLLTFHANCTHSFCKARE